MSERYTELVDMRSNLIDEISISMLNEEVAAGFMEELEEIDRELYFLDMADMAAERDNRIAW